MMSPPPPHPTQPPPMTPAGSTESLAVQYHYNERVPYRYHERSKK
jgi:hypothetical protein